MLIVHWDKVGFVFAAQNIAENDSNIAVLRRFRALSALLLLDREDSDLSLCDLVGSTCVSGGATKRPNLVLFPALSWCESG